MKRILVLLAVLLIAGSVMAQELSAIALPPPAKEGGKPLMECLATRHTSREFAPAPLPPQTLSNLLWAAFGINREDGHRTAPSAMNRQETDIYVFLAEGVYRHNAAAHQLEPVLQGDHRAATGGQDFVGAAPLNLVYVADFAKMGDGADSDKVLYSAADAGFIAENVYLYCASEGLAVVVRGWVDREALAKTLGLRADQRIILAHTIGYPK